MKKHCRLKKLFMAVAISGLALGSLFLSYASAEYPERPITMDVAFAPGGSMDMASRAMAAAASA